MKMIGDKAPYGFETFKPVELAPDAGQLFFRGTFYLGEPGVPLGVLLEVKLSHGTWSQAPIMSGAIQTNLTDKSAYFLVNDHINLTEFIVNLEQPIKPDRVGTPVCVDFIATKDGKVIQQKSFMLGFIKGAEVFQVPFFYAVPESFYNKDGEVDLFRFATLHNKCVINMLVLHEDGRAEKTWLGTIEPYQHHSIDGKDVQNLGGFEAGKAQVWFFCSSECTFSHLICDQFGNVRGIVK